MLIVGKSEPFLEFFCSCSFDPGEIYVVLVLFDILLSNGSGMTKSFFSISSAQ